MEENAPFAKVDFPIGDLYVMLTLVDFFNNTIDFLDMV